MSVSYLCPLCRKQYEEPLGSCPDDGFEAPGTACGDGSSGACDSPEELCLNQSRYAVRVDWAEPGGDEGAAVPVQLTDDTGTFWFFDEANLEIVLKVLDGCGVNGHFWVFAGGLTNVEATIRVRDRTTSVTRTYVNRQGDAFQPLQDVGAFACN